MNNEVINEKPQICTNDNDNALQFIWTIDCNTFIQEFKLEVNNIERSLKDILDDSLPEWALDGKIHRLIVQMVIKS